MLAGSRLPRRPHVTGLPPTSYRARFRNTVQGALTLKGVGSKVTKQSFVLFGLSRTPGWVDDTYPIYETGFLRSMRQLHLVW